MQPAPRRTPPVRRFRLRVRLTAPLPAVRAALLDPEPWLASWRHVRHLERLDAGAPDGRGRRFRTVVVAVVPYRLTWDMTLVEVGPHALIWSASGDLDGRAEVRLRPVALPRETATGTEVTIQWRVAPTPRWMRWTWPVAARVFVRNHDTLMDRGISHLAAHLDAEVTALDAAAVGHPGGRHPTG